MSKFATAGSAESLLANYTINNQIWKLQSGSPSYDANGNMLTDGLHSYTWDAEGKNVTTDGNGAIMTYDALGRWVERYLAVNGGYDEGVYSPAEPNSVLYIANGRTAKTGYLSLPGHAMAFYQGGTATFGHPDWLGTPRFFTNASRQGTNSVAYAPYGESYVNTAWNDAFWTDSAQSVESHDTKNFPARLYQTTQGRWLTPDPGGLSAVDLTNPQSWNRYAYVMGNPLNAVDPMGLYAEKNPPAMPIDCTRLAQVLQGNGAGGSGLPPACGGTGFEGGTPQPPSGGQGAGGGGGGQPPKPAKPPKPPKTGNPPLYCEPDIIAGMKKIWMQSGNGMNGTEASFNVNGTPDNYSLFFNPFTNQQKSQSFKLQFNTFANFHVHPNTGSWQPSTPSNNATGNGLGDTGMADLKGIQIYVVSRQGLGFYDPKTKLAPIRLRPGMDWSKPCGG